MILNIRILKEIKEKDDNSEPEYIIETNGKIAPTKTNYIAVANGSIRVIEAQGEIEQYNAN